MRSGIRTLGCILLLLALAAAPAIAVPAAPAGPKPAVAAEPETEAAPETPPASLPPGEEETTPIGGGDRVVFGGSTLRVRPDEVVRGQVVCIGASAIVEGEVRQGIVVIGGDLRLSGKVRNEVVGVFSGIVVEDKAEIGGEIVNVMGSLDLPEDVRVGGQVVNIPGPISVPPFSWAPLGGLFGFLFFWSKLLGLVLVFIGIVLMAAVVPERVRVISDEVPVRPFVGILTGFAVWIVWLLLLLSLIGTIPALLLYPVLKVLQWIGFAGIFHLVGFRLGRLLFKREMSLLPAILIGFLLFALLKFLPFCVGAFIWWVLNWMALGLVVLTRAGGRPSLQGAAAAGPEPPPRPAPEGLEPREPTGREPGME